MPRSDYDFFILLASQRLGFCWLGDFPIAQLLPMGFGCKCLIIMFLVFLCCSFATSVFWAMGKESSGAGSGSGVWFWVQGFDLAFLLFRVPDSYRERASQRLGGVMLRASQRLGFCCWGISQLHMCFPWVLVVSV